MRKLVSAGSNGSAAAVKQPRSVNSTPSKPKPVRPPVSGGAGTPSNKRRRVDYDNDDDRTISRQELRELGITNRTSPTPRQPPAPPVMAARHSTVASTVMPTSETSPPRTFGNGQAPPSRAPTASARPPSAAPGAAAAVAATAAQRALSANAQAFAARTPVSMEPTAGLARLSVTPGGGGGSVRPTPRRGTSVLAPIKLEDSADDDDALQGYDFDDDSDVSDWAEEV